MTIKKDQSFIIVCIADDEYHLLRTDEAPEEYEKLREKCKKIIAEAQAQGGNI